MIEIYGSFVTNLSIESSDIDISIRFDYDKHENINEIDNLKYELSAKFENMKNKFDKIQSILTASVPVIKLVSLNYNNLVN